MKYLRYVPIIVLLIYAAILLLLALDWGAKHTLYIEQRDILFSAIKGTEDYETLKKTVSYLQGTATRRLNDIKSASVHFAVSASLMLLTYFTFRKGSD